MFHMLVNSAGRERAAMKLRITETAETNANLRHARPARMTAHHRGGMDSEVPQQAAPSHTNPFVCPVMTLAELESRLEAKIGISLPKVRHTHVRPLVSASCHVPAFVAVPRAGRRTHMHGAAMFGGHGDERVLVRRAVVTELRARSSR
jgi:hypothetical protein